MRVLVAVALTMVCALGCRNPQRPLEGDESCGLARGTYVSHSTLVSSERSCPRAKAVTTDRLVFDGDGVFLSPAEGLIGCNTEQQGCDLLVDCTATLIGFHAQFRGVLEADSEALTGVATVTGYYAGCGAVVYDMEAARPQ